MVQYLMLREGKKIDLEARIPCWEKEDKPELVTEQKPIHPQGSGWGRQPVYIKFHAAIGRLAVHNFMF